MTRALPEWIGKTSDSTVPPRVRLRIFDKFEGRCQCGCNRKILAGERWDCEDKIAIINGGERREANLRPFLTEHHKAKTKDDVATKVRNYRRRTKHLGIKKRDAFPTNKACGWKKRMDGTVVRRTHD